MQKRSCITHLILACVAKPHSKTCTQTIFTFGFEIFFEVTKNVSYKTRSDLAFATGWKQNIGPVLCTYVTLCRYFHATLYFK